MSKQPTRRQLLAALAHLQTMIGQATGEALNDRSPDRSANVKATLTEAFDFCVAVLGADRPVTPKEQAAAAAMWPVQRRARI